MPYLGASPTVGLVTKLSNIASSFNGVTTTFQLSTPPGGVSNYFTPGSTYALFVRLGGVTQNPDVDYTVSGSQITFTTAPAAGLTCFIIAIGQAINIGVPNDGSVTDSKFGTITNINVGGLNGGQLAGTRNRIINGAMAVDQRNAGAAQTITAAAALAYSVDRWYAYCTGANVTGQRVQGATAGRFRYQFTGAASVTAIGFGQRIEQFNSADLAGTTTTLSVDLANSVLTTVTWTAFYANTADTFGTLASPTRTQFATGTFIVSTTVARYSTQISIPAAATTGIEIVFTVGAQTSGTWTVGDVQLESGTVATPFERRSYGQELALCQRYFCMTFPQGTAPQNALSTVNGCLTVPAFNQQPGGLCALHWRFPVEMRAAPTVMQYAPIQSTNGFRSAATAGVVAAVVYQTASGVHFSFSSTFGSNDRMDGHATASIEL